jgi:hypothetical protein
MGRIIKKCIKPEELDERWDELADCLFLKKGFLAHLQKHNFCSQLYYQLFEDGLLIAGTIVYSVRTNILTFLDIPAPFSFRVIGVPVSIASPPFVGNLNGLGYLLEVILKAERGLILGLNFLTDNLSGKVVNMRTLPTIMLNLPSITMIEYELSLRHPYRRRLRRLSERFKGVTTAVTGCSNFNDQHYDLYLQVMKASTTKLEILKADVFKFLPDEFELTTLYADGKMLFWYILGRDTHILYYFMCGMNYKYRDEYQVYHNSLFAIIDAAMKMDYKMIDLGQTAEIAKMRIGGLPSERRMFMYHKNLVVLAIIRIFRQLISYNTINTEAKVFKQKALNENIVRKTGTFA